ncbi:MAG TPA: SusD/RagB family nutrient-binding outer membrane lipoprotein [Saprospiraceae bacterium]|nr:SusD/RagB family nutrient-binding outer membrane lipoprotein [Saprospiraceae bacterium]
MKYILAIIPIFFLMSCVNSLEDYNIDSKRPSAVAAETLVSNAQKGMNDWENEVNVNVNVFRFYAQQITATEYLDEPRYDMVTRTIPQAQWNAMYVSSLADLNEAKRLIDKDNLLNADVKKNQLAIIDILEVYCYANLVNTFGDIPYTEALDVNNPQPKFDDAKTVTSDLLSRLATSTANLNENAGSFSVAADIIYGGKASKWVKFGNSLRMKIAMITADADEGLAKSNVSAGAGDLSKLITTNADNAVFKYQAAPNNNILSNDVPPRSSRKDFVSANTLVDKMNTLNDGRLGSYFSKVGDEFIGGIYGQKNTYSKFSTFSSKVISTTLPGDMLDAAEVNFLLAEAVERGFISGSAKDFYNAAIAASFEYWDAGSADDYIAQAGVDYDSAGSGATWREKIGTQKWIALFNRGFDAWTSWRLLDFPVLLPPDAPNVPEIPVRLIYPIVENSLNKANIEAAASKIGGDTPNTKLWWDVR